MNAVLVFASCVLVLRSDKRLRFRDFQIINAAVGAAVLQVQLLSRHRLATLSARPAYDESSWLEGQPLSCGQLRPDSISGRPGQATETALKPLQMADNLYLYDGHF